MPEILHTHNQQASGNLRPFSELLRTPGLVYHGIGADFMALCGISKLGIVPQHAQYTAFGHSNSNTPRNRAFNGDAHVSVALAPQTDTANEAFMHYSYNSPVSFAIDTQRCHIEQPFERGFFDEAFAEKVPLDAIVGIILDDKALTRPLASYPVVGRLESAQKARVFIGFVCAELNMPGQDIKQELGTLLATIKHLDDSYFAVRMGGIDREDLEHIEHINAFLQTSLELLAERVLGDKSATLYDAVRYYFPSTQLFLNSHTDGLQEISESWYYEKRVGNDELTGYVQYDGRPGNASLHKLRRAFGIEFHE